MPEYKRVVAIAATALIAIAISGCATESSGEGCEDDAPDATLLEAARGWIADNETFIDGFIVQHCGERIIEEYYRGFHAERPHDMQSATKTFTAMLVGIALDQGIIESLDQPIIELLPDYADVLEGDKALITLEHLLEMTSGLEWTDFGDGNSFERIAEAEDSTRFILEQPLVSKPGESFFYNTGSSHLLSAIVRYNSNMPTAKFADEYLFGPLGISEYEWQTHPDGTHQGGWQLYMRPDDSAKFGQMLLDEGVWNGERILSAGFIDAATTFRNATPYGVSGYGYHMWIETDFGADDLAAARGWGGQDIFVLDELDTVVVFNGDIWHPKEMKDHNFKLMSEFIIPALE